jgi:hypothetical protein
METELLRYRCVKIRRQSLPLNYITWKQYAKKKNTPYYNAGIDFTHYYNIRRFIWAMIKILPKTDFILYPMRWNNSDEIYINELYMSIVSIRNFNLANQFLEVAEKYKYDLKVIMGEQSSIFLDKKFYSIMPLNLDRDVKICFTWKYFEGYDKIISVHKISAERIMSAIFDIDIHLQIKDILKCFEKSKKYLMENYPDHFNIN